MAALKLIFWSCLMAILGYFAYRELQVDTLGFTVKIHIPAAKRSDVFHKLFDEPEFWLKIHPLCTGVSNIIRFKNKDGRRTIQYQFQERVVLLGFYDTGNITFQVTVKEIEENTATQVTASLMRGSLKISQGFHLADSEEGGTLLENHVEVTARRLLARLARREAFAAHTAVTENTRLYFVELSQQTQHT